MPEAMAVIPHASKIRILSDMSNVGTQTSVQRDSRTEILLCRGLAHGAGFGTRRNLPEFELHITESAKMGSAIASMVSKCLTDRDDVYQVLSRAFSDALDYHVDDQGLFSCRFRRQTSTTFNVSSFSSADGCNVLHYLPAFKCIGDNNNTIMRRSDFALATGQQRSHRMIGLRKLIKQFGPIYINSTTSAVHYIHPHFPLSFTGTPLAFAVILGCEDSVAALVLEGAEPLDPLRTLVNGTSLYSTSKDELPLSSALHVAVSCHRSNVVQYLWTRASSSDHHWLDSAYDLLFKDVSIGASLVSALAARSILERTVLHGSNRRIAQSNTIQTIVGLLVELAKQKNAEQSGDLVVELLSKGIQGVLRLGDVEIAEELIALQYRPGARSSQNVSSSISKKSRHDIVDVSLRAACSGTFDPEHSAQYLSFARDVSEGFDADSQAIETIMSWGASSLFQHCLDHDFWTHVVDEDGRNLLHHAISTGFCRQLSVSLILKSGVDVNVGDHEGITPLHLAAKRGMAKTAAILLDSGADATSVDGQGVSILHCAALSNELTVVTEILNALKLLESGNNIDSDRGIKMTIDFGNRKETRPLDGRSPLHNGIISCNRDIVDLLLCHGANVDIPDAQGDTPLHYALKLDEYSEVMMLCTMLLKQGADPSKANCCGRTPLHDAIKRRHACDISALLNLFTGHDQLQVHARDPQGQTILHHAVTNLAYRSVVTILASGASVHTIDDRGRTALHFCSQISLYSTMTRRSYRVRTSIAIAKELLDAGAHTMVRDFDGLCSLEYAAVNGNELLLSSFVKRIQGPSELRREPLSTANYQAIMASVWSFAFQEERWHVVKSLLTIQPAFKKDFSLFKWPACARFLVFLAESYLSLPPGDLRSTEYSNSNWKDLGQIDWKHGGILHHVSKVRQSRGEWMRKSQWESLPEDLKQKRIPWRSDQLRCWDSHVEQFKIDLSHDYIRETLEFIENWDIRIFMAYFRDSAKPLLELIYSRRRDSTRFTASNYSTIVHNIECIFNDIGKDQNLRSEFILEAMRYGMTESAGIADVPCKSNRS